MNILALNSGSSSLKFGLYRAESSGIETLLFGEAETIGDSDGGCRAIDSTGRELVSEKGVIRNQREAIVRIGKLIAESTLSPPLAIGHRVVHGGPGLLRHCRIDDSVIKQLETASVFAPLHTPATLEVIRFASEHFRGLPQVACFDTAFHADMPDIARTLPVPQHLQEQGVRRYGFHGISCESIIAQLGHEVPERMIIAHLGNGASITAVKSGKSVDTSMGLTPSGGVIIGTRSGDLDPGLLIYLLREKKFDTAMLEDMVNRRSGLFGISGVSSDMRALHPIAASNPAARLAIQMFCASVRKQIAAMISVMNGVDLLVFTGGIGENDAAVRALICDGLAWFGVNLDATRNRDASTPLNDAISRCSIRLLASREEQQIAEHTWALTQSLQS